MSEARDHILSADEVASLLDLTPLAGEGGRFRRVWSTEDGTAIYFLVTPDDFSAMHRLSGPELWHYYSGAPVQMVLLHEDGEVTRAILGDDLVSGQRPLVIVDTGVWMGAYPLGSWSLVGTTLAPPFEPEGFELGDPDELIAAYPSATDDIIRLIRTRAP
ncbi:MAG: cupin domain-containing protein [Acidimicrobiia bacterium]|nr:cupin domain-containing protein [Acidimicrobiia bacterium]